MSPKNLSSLLLVVLPILSLFVILICLYLFSNFKVSTNFVYFERSEYSSQNSLTVVNNKVEYGESESYKTQKQQMEIQKKELENCKSSTSPVIDDQICEKKLGFGQDLQKNQSNSIPPKIYLYDSEKETSKLIDLETAKGLTLIPERQNEAGESFESSNCSGGPGFLFGGYSGSCGYNSRIAIKKSYASKNVDLEVLINLEQTKFAVLDNQSQRNIYWIKK